MRTPKFESAVRFFIGFIATSIYLMPLFWMVSTSLKPITEIFQTPPQLIPAHPQIDSYRSALGLPTDRPELYITGALYFKNSFIIATSTMLLTLLCNPGRLCFITFKLRGKTPSCFFDRYQMPAVLLVIPLFVLSKCSDSIIPLQRIGGYSLALPFAIIILPGFIQVQKLWKKRDRRCFTLQVLWYIVLPVMRASLVAVGLLIPNGLGRFVFALSFLQNLTATNFDWCFQFIGMYKTQWDTMMAFSTLVAIGGRCVAVLQRRFING
jgi:multiple sugar transport system permease protein